MCQLRSCGILESIKIFSQGFPTKIGLEEFRARYKIICLEGCSIESCEQGVIQTVYKQEVESLSNEKSDDTSMTCNLFRIGKTKIFLLSCIIARLEREKERIIIQAISQIQTNFICNLTRKQFIHFEFHLSHCTIMLSNEGISGGKTGSFVSKSIRNSFQILKIISGQKAFSKCSECSEDNLSLN